MTPRSLTVAALLGLLPLALACQPRARAVESAPSLVVRGHVVKPRDLEPTLSLSGSLRPKARVDVVAEVPARVLRILKDTGDDVSAGEVVAVLDDTDARLQSERARAALAMAQAGADHAAAEKKRAEQLTRTGGITDKDREAADAAYLLAEAALAQARAEASIAATQLGRTQVKAPIDGRVARRSADPGAMLAVGAPLLTIVDDRVLELRAPVHAADVVKLRSGAPATVTTSAGAAVHAGRLQRIAPLADEGSRAVEITVEVPGGGGLIGGMFAEAAIALDRVPGALVVPPQALVRDAATPGAAQLFVVAGGKAVRRAVRTGQELPGAVQVLEGLTEGEVVVLDPPLALADGVAVTVAEPAPANASAGS